MFDSYAVLITVVQADDLLLYSDCVSSWSLFHVLLLMTRLKLTRPRPVLYPKSWDGLLHNADRP